MAESDISISEMTNGSFSAGAIFPAIQPDGQSSTGYSNVKLSGSDIGDGIGQLQFPLRLDTNNKTIFGAINEAANAYVNILPTDTATGSIASFPDGANGIPLQSLILNVKPYQAGTGDQSPDNVRPLSGWTQAVITRTGANLWNEDWELGIINNTTGEDEPNNSYIRSKGYTNVEANINVYCVTSASLRLVFYDKDKAFVGIANGNNTVVTIPNNVKYLRFYVNNSYYGTTYKNDISINYPSTDTAYHAHITPGTRTAEFDQIIYGATINPLTGEGSITHGIIVLDGTETEWVKSSTYPGGYYLTNWAFNNSIPQSSDHIQDRVKTVANSTEYGNTINCCYFDNSLNIRLDNSIVPTLEDFKSWLSQNNITVVYLLKTPAPITITPIENINTLYGANNIYQDAGDTTATYKADIGLYIDKKTS